MYGNLFKKTEANACFSFNSAGRPEPCELKELDIHNPLLERVEQKSRHLRTTE